MKRYIYTLILVANFLLVGCSAGESYYTDGNQMILYTYTEDRYNEYTEAFYKDLWAVKFGEESENLPLVEELSKDWIAQYSATMTGGERLGDNTFKVQNFFREIKPDDRRVLERYIPGLNEAIDEALASGNDHSLQILGGKYGDYLVTLYFTEVMEQFKDKYLFEERPFISIKGQAHEVKDPIYQQLQEQFETDEFLVTDIIYADGDENQYETMILQNAFYEKIEDMEGFARFLQVNNQEMGVYIPVGVSCTLYIDKGQVNKVRLVIKKQEERLVEEMDLEPLGVALKNWGMSQQEVEENLNNLLNRINNTKRKKEKGSIRKHTYRYNKISEDLFEYVEYVIQL